MSIYMFTKYNGIFVHIIQALLAKERAFERKERRAQKAEKVFLAEEKQEQQILKKKIDAERAVSAIRVLCYNVPYIFILYHTLCNVILQLLISVYSISHSIQ